MNVADSGDGIIGNRKWIDVWGIVSGCLGEYIANAQVKSSV